jgi:hypothetical protein
MELLGGVRVCQAQDDGDVTALVRCPPTTREYRVIAEGTPLARRRAMSFLRCPWSIGCLVLVACGATSTRGTSETSGTGQGDGGGGGATRRVGEGPDVCIGVATGAPACESAIDVSTVDALLDAMAAVTPFNQRVIGAAPAASQRPTRDVHVTTALTVDVDAFRAKAPRCPIVGDAGADASSSGPTGRPESCTETVFAQEKTFQVVRTIYGTLGSSFAPGVTCVEQATDTAGCKRVSIAAGSVVRFQMVREQNAFFGSIKNYLRIVRPCAAACAENETRCGASSLCVTSGSDFCILCEGKTEVACACRVGCQSAVDGESCGASTSEDTFIGGTCQQGSCAPTSAP